MDEDMMRQFHEEQNTNEMNYGQYDRDQIEGRVGKGTEWAKSDMQTLSAKRDAQEVFEMMLRDFSGSDMKEMIIRVS